MMMRNRAGTGTSTMVMTATGAAGGAASASAAVSSPALAEADPVEAAASEALVAISTMGRDVPYERVRELVETVLCSHTHRHHLPVLIMWMRNHGKSRAPGAGLGERSTPMQLLVALYECDPPVAMALLQDLTMYGSWRSVMQLLEFTEKLCEDDGGDATAPATRFGMLHQAIHALFAKQLQADLKALEQGGGVSNASKYAPHEGRNARLARHADAIASLLFPDADSAAGQEAEKKHRLRKVFRKARASLNECNQHIAEVYLAGGRSDELLPGMICGGTYDKLRKALLNVDKRGKERYTDEKRRILRKRILEKLAKDPTKLPAPTDLADLAEKLFSLHFDADIDAGERLLLQVQYRNAVQKLKDGIAERSAEISALIRQSGLDEDAAAGALAAAMPVPALVAIDATPSQNSRLATACLLALVLADAFTPAPGGEAAGGSDGAGASMSTPVILFGDSAHVHEVPRQGCPEARLAALLDLAKGESAQGGQANYAQVLSLLDTQGATLAGRDLVICSDFQNPEALPDAVRAWRACSSSDGAGEGVVSCWRMLTHKIGRRRERQPVWDAGNKRIDLVFLLDTTGSMGGEIASCKRQIKAICTKLTNLAEMPVSVAFVSYKDFGDAGHLEFCSWADTKDEADMLRLETFTGTLVASGGGDTPEDVAGGLEVVKELFRERAPSLRLCLLMADAPCHGRNLNSGGDRHQTHQGVDQAERTLGLVGEIFGKGGVELLFCKCGAYDVEKMVQSFDNVLGKHHAFVDEFSIDDRSSEQVFKESILASLESCLAQAIAPATEGLGLDLYSGTDFSVALEIACRRLADHMNDALAGGAEDEGEDGDDEERVEAAGVKRKLSGGKDEDQDDVKGGSGGSKGKDRRAKMSALQLLLLKLEKEDYDLVRVTVSGVSEGLFKDFRWCRPLTEASMDVLQKTGLSVADLREAAYPDVIIEQYDQYLTSKMSS